MICSFLLRYSFIVLACQSAGAETLKFSHHFTAKTVDDALSPKGHQFHRATLPRFKTYRRAGRNIQPEPPCFGSLKLERRVSFKKW